MRLTKKVYAIKVEEKHVGFDELGRPIYEKVNTYYPIDCEVEPYSDALAEKNYGVFVDATNRVFSRPNDLFKLKDKVKYNNQIYEITQIVKYDKHFETLLKYISKADDANG